MACTCFGADRIEVDPAEKERNERIKGQLAKDKDSMSTTVKLLLLGAGESGKSTIAKQMKIIHLDGFPEEERNSYKAVIFNNTFNAMKTILQASLDLDIHIKLKKNRAIAKRVLEDEHYFSGEITKDIAEDFTQLWADAGVQKTYSRQNEYQLTDSAAYYIEAVERLASDDYVPTVDDLLRSRAKTTGIIETEFVVEGTTFKMVDVGGQRSERKKWMHCFTDVTAIIFCIALSEYDLKLYEDNETNRMHESLKLFREICNSKWFIETSTILFLNKSDLFREKLANVSIKVAFPDFPGPDGDFDAAVKYITEQFVKLNESNRKQVYPHVTCATDTNNVRVVFAAVKDIILNTALRRSGLTV